MYYNNSIFLNYKNKIQINMYYNNINRLTISILIKKQWSEIKMKILKKRRIKKGEKGNGGKKRDRDERRYKRVSKNRYDHQALTLLLLFCCLVSPSSFFPPSSSSFALFCYSIVDANSSFFAWDPLCFSSLSFLNTVQTR